MRLEHRARWRDAIGESAMQRIATGLSVFVILVLLPIAAGGHIYLVSRNGGTVVLKASDKLEIAATNTLEEGFDASPVAAGKELYLRGRSNLYCIAEN